MIFLFLALSAARAPVQSPAPIAAGHARVIAHFVDESGVSIPNVRVRRISYPEGLGGESDVDGRFAAEVPCLASYGGVWYGEARAAGHATVSLGSELRRGREGDMGRIVLPPGGVVVGRVVDGDGRPLAGARAVVFDRADAGPPGSSACEDPDERRLSSSITEADGSYRIEGLPVGQGYVWFQHESAWARWIPQPVEIRAREEVRLHDVVLVARPPQFRIEGYVLDDDGVPIPDVEVETGWFFPRGGGECLQSVLDTDAITDADGRFVLHLLQVFEPGHTLGIRDPAGRFGDEALEAVAAGTRDLVIRLSPLRSFELAVADADGKPIERFNWELSHRFESSRGGDGLHAGGRATVRVRDEPFQLMVEARGYRRKMAGRFEAGELPAVEVVLERGPAVSGVVMSANGPVAGAVVEWVDSDASSLSKLVPGHETGLFQTWLDGVEGVESVVTDALGRFELPSQGAHLETSRVRARAEGFASALSNPVQDLELCGLVLVLSNGGTVAGSVRLPGEHPHAPLEVELFRGRNVIGLDDDPPIRARVGDDGGFRVDHLEPGAWLVALIPSATLAADMGFGAERTNELRALPWVVHVADEETTRLDIDLARSQSLCRLVGHLSWGDHLQQGSVRLLLDGPMALEVAAAPLGDGGRFEIAVRNPGTYRLVVRGGVGPFDRRTVTDLVELSPGANEWSRELLPERWRMGDVRLDR